VADPHVTPRHLSSRAQACRPRLHPKPIRRLYPTFFRSCDDPLELSARPPRVLGALKHIRTPISPPGLFANPHRPERPTPGTPQALSLPCRQQRVASPAAPRAMPSPAAVPTGPTRPLPNAYSVPDPEPLAADPGLPSGGERSGGERRTRPAGRLLSLKVAQRRCGSGFSRDGPPKRPWPRRG